LSECLRGYVVHVGLSFWKLSWIDWVVKRDFQ